MKYIIEDKKLFDSIYNFIDNIFVEDNLSWNYEEDYGDEDYNENIIEFIGDKYSMGDTDDKYFIYIKTGYYEDMKKNSRFDGDYAFADDWIDKSPLLDCSLGTLWCNKLNNFFGDYWKPVFEQWFADSYPDFPVKTFMYPE